jgi:hypothetical protein
MYILRASDEKEKIKNTLFRRVAQITLFYYYKTVHLFVHNESKIIFADLFGSFETCIYPQQNILN